MPNRKPVSGDAAEESERTFTSVEDYLVHYSASRDNDSKQSEWYELGVEASQLAIKHAEKSGSRFHASGFSRGNRSLSNRRVT